ncbi:hypothetical protein VCRA2133E348_370021 [Vibrio crassostreae]|nr:hypothetical protein VCRA2133E348_370021 [Vibrio crassostreae]CAK3404764.1 hypothetical protein VCRA2123O443_40163 [Vibrio crassostreae]CAK3408486.1 hypothetical protein VCRA213O314_380021 [Vibrio crassostreae]
MFETQPIPDSDPFYIKYVISHSAFARHLSNFYSLKIQTLFILNKHLWSE